MEPSLQNILELRNKFTQRCTEEGKDFHPKDITRVSSDDKWVSRFLIQHDLDVKEALNMLMDTCEWRKNFKVNEINENILNKEYLHEGSLFARNRDKDGKSILVFNLRKYVKGQKDIEDMKKIVVYWFERLERQDKGDQITVFFDMQDTGLSNLDMEYINYIVSLNKLYYPHFVNYILIFEMPWIMNAAFKIIKTWMPTKAVQRIKFVDKKSLKEIVDSSQALTIWGGEDTYEFVFVPENATEVKNEENKKKVHFADGSNFADLSSNTFGEVKHDENVSNLRLVLNPSDSICFNQEGLEFSGTLNISNISDAPLIYKVKTTSPDKFRVRPCFGILSSSANASISVNLLSGHSGASILRDRFLVMCYPIENDYNSHADFNDIWKANSTDSKKLEEHKLRCRVPSIQPSSHNGAPGAPLGPTGSPTSELEQKMTQLLLSMNHVSEVNSKLQSSVNFLQNLVIIIGVLFIAFGFTLFLNLQGSKDICHASPNTFLEPPISSDK